MGILAGQSQGHGCQAGFRTKPLGRAIARRRSLLAFLFQFIDQPPEAGTENADLIELALQGFALGQLVKELCLVVETCEAPAVAMPAAQQLFTVAAVDAGVGHAQITPRGRVAIELAQDVVLGISGAAKNLARVVRQTSGRRSECFGSQDLDEQRSLDRRRRKIQGRQRMIKRLDQVTTGSHLGYHLLNGAELADGVACFFVMKQARELDAAGGMGHGPPAELVGHAEGDGRQVGGAEHLPQALKTVEIGIGPGCRQHEVVQRYPAQTRPAQAERLELLNTQPRVVDRQKNEMIAQQQ